MKKFILFFLLIIFILAITLGGLFIPRQSDMTVTVDGTPISFSAPPFSARGALYVPAEEFAAALGCEYESEVTTLRLKEYGTRVSMTVGIHAMDVNGENKLLLTPAREQDGIFYVPAKTIIKELGLSFSQKDDTLAITLPEFEGLLTEAADGEATLFTNHVDGFSLSLPGAWEADMSMPLILSRFENDDTVLEVYREENSDLGLRSAYIAYSNRAVTESSDLTVTAQGAENHSGNKFEILAWERPKLSRIENDKNHYFKADYTDGAVVYTLLLKGTAPVESLGREILDSFSLVPITCPTEVAEAEMPVFSGGESKKSAETEAYFEETFGESASLTWGMYEASYLHTWDMLPANEKAVDFHFPILLLYSEFYDAYRPEVVTRFLETAWSEGRVLELTLQPPGNADPHNFLYDVLDGKYDEFLTDYAQAIADFGHPVLFRPFNEANGDWCEYSAYQMSMDTELVRILTRYVGSFFDRAGADNVIWIFNPNGDSFPNFKWNDQRLYYPGDEYVDVWGITAYNTGNYYEGETWQDFDTLYTELYENTLKMTDMPLMITEFACARMGGDKESWVRDMHEKIGNYPKIKVAVWWSFADYDGETVSRAYYFLDSEELAPIWKEYLDTLE